MKLEEIKAYLAHEDPRTRELAKTALTLAEAIRTHRDKSGHELCWLNDVELWIVLGEDANYPHTSLPVRSEFLRQCALYHESRLKGSAYEEPVTRECIKELK